MRLDEIILTEAEETGKRLSDKDLEIIYKYIKPTGLSIKEVKDIANEVVENNPDYKRNPGSALFALTRMHALVHGKVPEGVTAQTAEKWFNPPETMKNFLRKKGYDIEENIDRAKKEVAQRKVKRNKKTAIQLMSNFYKENKNQLKDDVSKYRDDIIKDLQDGATAEEAFAKYRK